MRFSRNRKLFIKNLFKLTIIDFVKKLPAELKERFDHLIATALTFVLVPVNERPAQLCDPTVLYCGREVDASSPENLIKIKIIYQVNFLITRLYIPGLLI